jgi:hypothetical protein
MLSSIRQKRVLVAAVLLSLAGALAVSAADTNPQRHLAKIKKHPDGSLPLKEIANYNDYSSDADYHAEIKELTDPEAIAKLNAKHGQINVTQELNGGILNGTMEIGTSVVTFDVTGGGTLQGFQHTFTMPANFEVDSAPHNSTSDIDTFETNMVNIQGSGSDDLFESIQLVGGTANGYPSPGQMTLITQGDQVTVDSFFNVGFRLTIKGAAGGPFAGVVETVEGNVTMRSYASPTAPGQTPASSKAPAKTATKAKL